MEKPMNNNGRKRILIFSLVYYPRFVGGAEIAIKQITDRLGGDFDFDMVTLRLDSTLPKVERVGNVNVYRVGWSAKSGAQNSKLPFFLNLNKYAYLLTGYLRARKLARSLAKSGKGYDAVWSMMASYNSFAALFFKWANPKVPFILTLQEGDPTEYMERRARPLWPLFKAIFRRADHIQTISKFLADWAKKMGAKCPITVVPNAVDVELFSQKVEAEKLVALKTKLNKADSDVFLVTTSRLVKKNAVGDIIDALRYLPANVRLLVLGTGELEAELKVNAQSLEDPTKDKQNSAKPNQHPRVLFLGYIPHEEMPPYLQISDIFVRPSLSEGLGNSFLEAMAVGLPVIATPVGGIPDFLIDGETGLFCEPENPRSIAQKVEKLIKDKESRDYIVKRAGEVVRKRYEWGGVATAMKDIFSKAEIGYNERP